MTKKVKGHVMRTLVGILLWSCAFFCFASGEDPQVAGSFDPAELVGTYRLVAGERNGDKVAPERLQDITVRITKDAITTLDKDEKEVYVATYQIDAGRKPFQVTLTAKVTPTKDKGEEAAGLIEIDGDTVKLIYALPGGDPPTDFRTGDKQQMFVMKKIARLARKGASTDNE